MPIKYREKYGIIPGVPVKVFDEGTGIGIKTVEEGNMIKAKYSKAEFRRVLNDISEYVQENGPIWTEEDDKLRMKLKKKDKERDKRLNW